MQWDFNVSWRVASSSVCLVCLQTNCSISNSRLCHVELKSTGRKTKTSFKKIHFFFCSLFRFSSSLFRLSIYAHVWRKRNPDFFSPFGFCNAGIKFPHMWSLSIWRKSSEPVWEFIQIHPPLWFTDLFSSPTSHGSHIKECLFDYNCTYCLPAINLYKNRLFAFQRNPSDLSWLLVLIFFHLIIFLMRCCPTCSAIC